jgi:hypothetical protein
MNDLPAVIRRLGTFAGLIAAALIFIGGLMTKGGANVLSYIGVALAVFAWLVGLYLAFRMRSWGWIGLLTLTALISAVVAVGGFSITGSIDPVNVFIPIAYMGFAACLSKQRDITERTVIATLGVIALLTIIVSGAFAGGGGIGSTTDPQVYLLNVHMYAIAGFLGGLVWILAIISTLRIRAWGWLMLSVLLFGIGALMFGLFGPTAEDIRQGRLQKAARRAAGVR